MKESTLSETIAGGFIASYRDCQQQVYGIIGKLTEGELWNKPYPYGNSVGHLTLHLIGNLSHFIGAEIAGTGYVRDRQREFTEQHTPSREELLAQLDRVIDMVAATIESQSADGWGEEYNAAATLSNVNSRFGIVLKCAVHFHHHIG